jgi:hypothetical protein
MASKTQQNYINHIALVLDASLSMLTHASDVVKVADTQIQALAEQSTIMDQETRVSVYTFNWRDNIQCLIYDKDVLRMPSISGLYNADGQTALCSATVLAINDLKLTPEKYGEHAFLIYVITDGMENNSAQGDRKQLPGLIGMLPDHWTMAAFVPDAQGVHYAKSLGFPKDNIAVWDTTTSNGFLEVGKLIKKSTENFMQGRTKGIRGSKSLLNLTPVSTEDIKKSLTPLTRGSYTVNAVVTDSRIDEFISSICGSYTPGRGYYEMTKREDIQPYKEIAIETGGDVYMGASARKLLGISETNQVRVGPGDHPGYTIFVQSTAHNRKLLGGTRCLIMR